MNFPILLILQHDGTSQADFGFVLFEVPVFISDRILHVAAHSDIRFPILRIAVHVDHDRLPIRPGSLWPKLLVIPGFAGLQQNPVAWLKHRFVDFLERLPRRLL
ncbi:hypothetical protein D3C74_286420 [compost metagenome]